MGNCKCLRATLRFSALAYGRTGWLQPSLAEVLRRELDARPTPAG